MFLTPRRLKKTLTKRIKKNNSFYKKRKPHKTWAFFLTYCIFESLFGIIGTVGTINADSFHWNKTDLRGNRALFDQLDHLAEAFRVHRGILLAHGLAGGGTLGHDDHLADAGVDGIHGHQGFAGGGAVQLGGLDDHELAAHQRIFFPGGPQIADHFCDEHAFTLRSSV